MIDRAVADNERNSNSSHSLRELSQKLAETNNTVRLLEDRLKEKESTINRLEQEKGKLETYAKRSLTTFKEKYLAVLQTIKDEKVELESKFKTLTEKMIRNQDAWHREEKLISSAMFEVNHSTLLAVSFT